MGESTDANICPSCGNAVVAEARYCAQCGQALDVTTRAQEPVKPKWYYNVWFVLFMLFFVLGPFGLPLVWKNPRFSRWVKMLLTVVMIFYTVALIELTIRAFRAVMNSVNQFNSTLQF